MQIDHRARGSDDELRSEIKGRKGKRLEDGTNLTKRLAGWILPSQDAILKKRSSQALHSASELHNGYTSSVEVIG